MALERPPRDSANARASRTYPLEAALAGSDEIFSRSRKVRSCSSAGPAVGPEVKNGAGTIPVRIAEGWLSFFHGVDLRISEAGLVTGLEYQGGIVIHDAERPHIVRYRSPAPFLRPETADERRGAVANVVFPTGVDVRPGAGPRDFDVYYGMADSRIGRVRVVLHDT